MTTLATTQLKVEIGSVLVTAQLQLTLSPGQCWGILGRNGAGKTTLLHTLAGLREPQAGTVAVDDRPLETMSRRDAARHLGVLFQEETTPFPATVLETALVGRHPYLGRWSWEDGDDMECARQALRTVGIADLEARLVSTLSGGERRRLALATLLTQDPEILLLDEPTNHLDLHHQIQILNHLRQLATERGKALMVILHDINLATRFCDHLLMLLGDGSTVAGPAREVIDIQTLEQLYQHPLQQIDHEGSNIWLPR